MLWEWFTDNITWQSGRYTIRSEKSICLSVMSMYVSYSCV